MKDIKRKIVKMANEEVYLGSHVSMSAPDYYLGSVREALSYGANTLMFYTGAPQNTFRLPLERLKIAEGRALLKEQGIDETKVVVHAPYIINIANQLNENVYDLAQKALAIELQRTAAFGVKIMVLHPGSHVSTGVENGISSIVKALDHVLDQDHSDVKIALETMAGKGGEMGSTFEQLAEIISKIKHPERVGVCLDTCHISDYGYNIKDIDSILMHFDQTIGLEKLLCIHINDSKNIPGSHKDRHENIGYGTIGFDALNAFVHHPLLKDIPKLLETPYIDGKAPYKEEIETLRKSQFKNWR